MENKKKNLLSYLDENKYVARCSQWCWHDDSRIDILNSDGQVVTTLNNEQTWIFHEADGGHTVKSLLEWSASHYQGEQTPPDLDYTNLQTLEVLVEELRVVVLVAKAPVLPAHYLSPQKKK